MSQIYVGPIQNGCKNNELKVPTKTNFIADSFRNQKTEFKMRTKFLLHVSGQVNFNIVGECSSANRTFASYSFAQNITARDADHVTAWL